MMHPKQIISTKRGHTCTTIPNCNGGCACGPVSKRPATGGEGEESLVDSLFSLVTVAEQQRQAQERSSDGYTPHWNPLACSAPPVLSSRQSIFPPAERLIAFTTSSREYPHLRPVPLQELASIKLFRAWVRRSFEFKDDCFFVLVDRSVEANVDENGLIDSDMKLLRAKDIEIVEVPQEEADRAQEKEQQESPTNNNATNNNSNNNTNNTNNSHMQNHQELLHYAKSIIMFLSEKGNTEARSIITTSPSSFVACTPLSSILSSESHPYPLHNSTGALVPSTPSSPPPSAPPALPRVVAQAPPCLIPGYYIFSPVFDSFGEKRKLPIKIEIPRALVLNGERYKTVSTYIGLGPFGNDPNSFLKLEGDHLVGTVASRLEDDEEGSNSGNTSNNPQMCTYVFKNLRLKTRSLIRTVLDVAYNGMRTGRFFFMVDNEVLPNTSRRFEIKAPSGYTIKMVNKTARSNPVAKHSQPTSPTQSQPSSPPTPPDHMPLSHSQSLPPHSPPSSGQQQSQSSPSLPQLQLPPSVLMQMKQKQSNNNNNSNSSNNNHHYNNANQTQIYQQLQSFLSRSSSSSPLSSSSSSLSSLSSLSASSSGTLSPPTMPKGFPHAALPAPLPMHTQIHTQTQQSLSSLDSSPTPLIPFHRPIITSSI